MAIRGERGWQSEKTLSECMRYMLDNELATDVCFEVGPPDGVPTTIRAHKYMLMARSPVFEAMFSSGMTESNSGSNVKIRVEDIEVLIFKELLLYIYCEVISVNVKTAACLMYAAKKYLLPKLVAECGKCLSEGLNSDNVIQVLEQSLLFDAKELQGKCLQVILQNANTVLTGAEILSASKQTMDVILQMDTIPVREIVLYETCLAWVKHQLQIQRSTVDPTDQQIRETLGDLLYKIRFPTMDGNEFAEISEGQSVLTAEEKSSIYYYLMTKKKGSQLMFPTERRLSEEVWIERTVTCMTGQWTSKPLPDAINFTTNHDIFLTGIGLYTGFNGFGYAIDVEVFQSDNSLFKERLTVPATGDENQFKVSINEPISIKAGVLYSIKTLSHDSIGHYGQPCQAVCTKGSVTFTFSQSHLPKTSTSTTRGQIPRLYFRY